MSVGTTVVPTGIVVGVGITVGVNVGVSVGVGVVVTNLGLATNMLSVSLLSAMRLPTSTINSIVCGPAEIMDISSLIILAMPLESRLFTGKVTITSPSRDIPTRKGCVIAW